MSRSLKTRLLGAVLIRDGIAVQSYGFRRFLPVGRPEIAVEFLDRWGIDEIALLDMTATRQGRCFDPHLLERCAACCRTPLAVGGGIRDVAQIATLLHAGADKVVINSAAAGEPDLIRLAAASFGAQCVVVSIDAQPDGQGGYRAWAEGGRLDSGRDAIAWASEAAALGAGELLVNAIHCDGAAQGYDLELIRRAAQAVDIPVIALGGAGHPQHFANAAAAGADALAAANYWQHTEHSVTVTKRFLMDQGHVAVRLDTLFNYDGFAASAEGRLAMSDEKALEALRFKPLPEDEAMIGAKA